MCWWGDLCMDHSLLDAVVVPMDQQCLTILKGYTESGGAWPSPYGCVKRNYHFVCMVGTARCFVHVHRRCGA